MNIFPPPIRFVPFSVLSLMVCLALSYVHTRTQKHYPYTTTFLRSVCIRSSGRSSVTSIASQLRHHCQHSWFKNENKKLHRLCNSVDVERVHVWFCAWRCMQVSVCLCVCAALANGRFPNCQKWCHREQHAMSAHNYYQTKYTTVAIALMCVLLIYTSAQTSYSLNRRVLIKSCN